MEHGSLEALELETGVTGYESLDILFAYEAQWPIFRNLRKRCQSSGT